MPSTPGPGAGASDPGRSRSTHAPAARARGRRARSGGPPPGCRTATPAPARRPRRAAHRRGHARRSAAAGSAPRACRTRSPGAGPASRWARDHPASEKEPTQTRSQESVRAIRSRRGCSAASALMSTFQRDLGEGLQQLLEERAPVPCPPRARAVPRSTAGRRSGPPRPSPGPASRRGRRRACRPRWRGRRSRGSGSPPRPPAGTAAAVFSRPSAAPPRWANGDGAGMVEVGVAYPRGHGRSIACSRCRPVATTVLPASDAGDGEHAQESWASGPMDSAYSDRADADRAAQGEAGRHDRHLDGRPHQPDRAAGAPVQPRHQAVARARAEPGRDVQAGRRAVEHDARRAAAGSARPGRAPRAPAARVASIAMPITKTLETVPRPGPLAQRDPQQQHHRADDDRARRRSTAR